jgi:hypothetical protein
VPKCLKEIFRLHGEKILLRIFMIIVQLLRMKNREKKLIALYFIYFLCPHEHELQAIKAKTG